MLDVTARRDRLDAEIETMAEQSENTPIVDRLCCLRGVSTLTGFGLAVEIGDWHRFTGKTIGVFVGLVPSEYSSGTSRSLGAVTKTDASTCGFSSLRLPGTPAAATSSAKDCEPGLTGPRPQPATAGTPATGVCTSGG